MLDAPGPCVMTLFGMTHSVFGMIVSSIYL